MLLSISLPVLSNQLYSHLQAKAKKIKVGQSKETKCCISYVCELWVKVDQHTNGRWIRSKKSIFYWPNVMGARVFIDQDSVNLLQE